jgi:hypothetical protein
MEIWMKRKKKKVIFDPTVSKRRKDRHFHSRLNVMEEKGTWLDRRLEMVKEVHIIELCN